MTALTNNEIRLKILSVLQKKIFEDARDPRVYSPQIAEETGVPIQLVEYNLRYLGDKMLVDILSVSRSWGYTSRINAFGIDVLEKPENFVNDFPFLKIYIQNIGGNVKGHAIQAEDSEIKIENDKKSP